MTALDGMRTIVIGAGRAGRGAVRVLADRGARVRVLDRAAGLQRDRNWPLTVELRSGDDRQESLAGVDLVVPSPGVAADHPLLRGAVARGIPVWSEIELAARFLTCPILAITGTNGKSTTTVLLGEMLAAHGCRVFVGGNLGNPLSDALRNGEPYEAAVVEVSSFQLEWVATFRPRVAVLLNLSPDHQDRYASMAEYGAAKTALLVRQESGDTAVLNRDDAWVWQQRHRTRGSVLSFGRDPVEFGTFIDGDDAVVWGAGQAQRYAISESPLLGAHNRENILAAITAASAWGVSSQAVRAGLRRTRGLPHRLEFVRQHCGARYYDDSKATNVGAVEKSLASFSEEIVLLLGGYDKGGDFTALLPRIGAQVTHVLCFGKAGPHIRQQLGDTAPCLLVPDMAGAVRVAADVARAGQVVILAPGCASFDEFTDYAERGRRFRALVEAL